VRARRFDEARALLAKALDEFTALGADASIIELEARTAELLLQTGEVADALELATKAHEAAVGAGGLPVLQSMLNRIRGQAHLLRGDHALAQDCLDESLRLARSASAGYEEALTLGAWAELARATGRRTAKRYEHRAGEILRRLGVGV
jgi:ATP/maltotriose-dependent transcriptional regulator MalT